MRRRNFIALLGGVTAWPLTSRAQQQPLSVVGFLTSYAPDALGLQRLAAVEQGLAESGFVVGKNVVIEARWAEGNYDRLPAMAADLVRRQVKVILATTRLRRSPPRPVNGKRKQGSIFLLRSFARLLWTANSLLIL